jgi:predicted transposase/invertase (TIGR01784 family)
LTTNKSSDRPLISFDWAIKRLLRNKADFGILEGFLSELFKQDLLIEEILESETNQEEDDDKQIVADLLCKTSEKELILIEIQFSSQHDFFHRMLYGTSRIITERLKLGEKYEKLVKVYSVNLVYFDLGQGEDYVYHGITQFKGIHKQDILKTSFAQRRRFQKEEPGEFYPEYYILKINHFNDLAKTPLDEWIYYLKNEALPKKYRAKGLSLVAQILKVNQMNAKELQTYKKFKDQITLSESVYETAYFEGEYKGREEGIEQGIEQGREEGIEQGKREREIKIVINGFKEGFSIESISKIAEIPETVVHDILKKHDLI